jgi:hypothetical protein
MPRLAGIGPAALEAGAVVGQDAVDGDPVPPVEADELVEEGEGRVGALVRAEPSTTNAIVRPSFSYALGTAHRLGAGRL